MMSRFSVCAQKQRSMAAHSAATHRERDYSELVELLARYQSRRLDEQRASMPQAPTQMQTQTPTPMPASASSASASASAPAPAPEQHLISAHQRQRQRTTPPPSLSLAHAWSVDSQDYIVLQCRVLDYSICSCFCLCLTFSLMLLRAARELSSDEAHFIELLADLQSHRLEEQRAAPPASLLPLPFLQPEMQPQERHSSSASASSCVLAASSTESRASQLQAERPAVRATDSLLASGAFTDDEQFFQLLFRSQVSCRSHIHIHVLILILIRFPVPYSLFDSGRPIAARAMYCLVLSCLVAM